MQCFITIRDKVSENALVMHQIANNTPEQAMLGDFPKAVDEAVMNSSEAHQYRCEGLQACPQQQPFAGDDIVPL